MLFVYFKPPRLVPLGICAAVAIQLLASSATAQQQSVSDRRGVITVGKPKVWRYERVYSTLDGLLRDVNAITVTSLSNLDPNSPNSASLDFIQQALNTSISYDGVAGAQNNAYSNKIQSAATYDHTRTDAANSYLLGLEASRASLASQYSALSAQLPAVTDSTVAQSTKSRMTDLAAQITSLNTLIAGGAPTATSQQLSSTDIAALKSTAPASGAPTGLTSPFDIKALSDKMLDPAKATLPASKQIDNFVALLHERLLHQLSVIYDDKARSEADIYLVEFDVGLYPSKRARHRLARVEFDVSETDNPALCGASADSGIHAYELYPDAASYNISTFYGKSNHTGVRGAASFLMGFGGTLEYQRQRDSIRSSLNQNIYVSGFGAGTCRFGWYYAPNPFEDRVAPAIRSGYVLLVVPKKSIGGALASQKSISMIPRVSWIAQDNPVPVAEKELAWNPVALPEPESAGIAFESVEYTPVRSSPHLNDVHGTDSPVPNATMNLTFKQPIDPNLVITVNGHIIKRVRDTRGQGTGTSKGITPGQVASGGTTTFGLLESDAAGADTWIAMGSRSLQLTLSKATAGEDQFPVIGITDSGHTVASFTSIAAKAGELTIDGKVFSSGDGNAGLRGSIWVPLFLSPMQSTKNIVADVEVMSTSPTGTPGPSRLRLTLTPNPLGTC